jgi:hypothetical protein
VVVQETGIKETSEETKASGRIRDDGLTWISLDGRSVRCRLVDLSPLTALVDAGFRAPVGTPVVLHMPSGDLAPANVVRITSSYTALAFKEPLTPN